jgi:hypothetical protein
VATAAELTHAADHPSASYVRSQLLEYVRQIRELAGEPVRSERLERVGWSAGHLEERPGAGAVFLSHRSLDREQLMPLHASAR